jgi:hypothetical protein
VKGWIASAVAGALAVAAGAAPAHATPDTPQARAARKAPTPAARFGTFTPAAADPRLAAVFARSGLSGDPFRFTPAETHRASRAVTVAIRSRTSRTAVASAAAERLPALSATATGVAPIAYNLGVALGWQRFSIAGDVAHIDLFGQPGSRDSADLGVSYSLNRFTGRVRGSIDRPLAGASPLTEPPEGVTLDLGGSYAVTRRFDLTAGLRYRSERDPILSPTGDGSERRDSQALYVGTAFRF